MRWIKPSLSAGFFGLLGHSSHWQESRLANRLEDIRLTMLDALGEEGCRDYPAVVRRVRFAGDAQGLWYARGDLMSAMADMYGEAEARKKMTSLNTMFHGLLPAGMASRPTSVQTL